MELPLERAVPGANVDASEAETARIAMLTSSIRPKMVRFEVRTIGQRARCMPRAIGVGQPRKTDGFRSQPVQFAGRE
jgi:hypothetical protein